MINEVQSQLQFEFKNYFHSKQILSFSSINKVKDVAYLQNQRCVILYQSKVVIINLANSQTLYQMELQQGICLFSLGEKVCVQDYYIAYIIDKNLKIIRQDYYKNKVSSIFKYVIFTQSYNLYFLNVNWGITYQAWKVETGQQVNFQDYYSMKANETDSILIKQQKQTDKVKMHNILTNKTYWFKIPIKLSQISEFNLINNKSAIISRNTNNGFVIDLINFGKNGNIQQLIQFPKFLGKLQSINIQLSLILIELIDKHQLPTIDKETVIVIYNYFKKQVISRTQKRKILTKTYFSDQYKRHSRTFDRYLAIQQKQNEQKLIYYKHIHQSILELNKNMGTQQIGWFQMF